MEAMVETEQFVESENPRAHRRAVVAIVLMLLAMLSSTVWAGWVTKTVVEKRVRAFFERQADQIANTYYREISTSVLMLEGVRGLWNSRGKMDYQRFSLFVDSLEKNMEELPGTSSFFYITQVKQDEEKSFIDALRVETDIPPAYKQYMFHPDSNEELLYPVAYVHPLVERETTLGLDFGTFPERLAAILYAKDNNALATTQAVVLNTTGKPGFFFLLPLYKPGKVLDRLGERRSAFVGVVGVAFRSEDAFRQIFGKDDPYPNLDFQIYQGEAMTPDRLLHDHDSNFVAQDPKFRATRVVRLRGQSWTIVVESKPGAVLGSEEERLPLWVFGGGVVLTTIVTTYFAIRYWRHLREHSLVR